MAVIIYKCGNCGGPVKYSAALGKFSCEYCNTAYIESEVKELPLISGEDAADTASETLENGYLEYHCPSCGAQIVTEETTVATNCYYCNNPVILSGKLESSQMPVKVIPFGVERSKAVELFENWVKTKKFVPKSFFNDKREMGDIKGVYFPYSLYNTTVHVDLDREGSRVFQRTEGDYRVSYRKNFRIIRKGEIDIDNLPKIALSKSNKILVESVYPFDFDKAVNFDSSYLSGFMAEKRDIDDESLIPSINEDVYKYSAEIVNRSMTGEHVNVVDSDFRPEKGEFEYAMLPVWTIAYNDKESDKRYFFSINGQSGKVVGELPVDRLKLGLSGLLISIPLFIICALFCYFTENLTSTTFMYISGASILVYILYVLKINNDYKMKSSSVRDRVVNQVAFNNKYASRFEYSRDIDLGTRVIGRTRIEKKN